VQGVGFRPFVYRTAQALKLRGWVQNDNQGALLEVQGERQHIEEFVSIVASAPSPARVDAFARESCALLPETGFAIIASYQHGPTTATILPEIATCADCLREIDDPNNRRYQYPFTNCTHCGPRFTIIEALPYDRPNTSMSIFTMCEDCKREYDDPLDRRFHAQPNACPVCGPQLRLVDRNLQDIVSSDLALSRAAEMIQQGLIVAVQGLGGFHLIVAATHEAAISLLRQRKHRWEKPLAVMVQNVEQAREHIDFGPTEEALLTSPEGPIVLARKREQSSIASGVAPDTQFLGVMLATTPLHHLLLNFVNAPIVATSGNLSEEPICIEPREATLRLADIADAWLVHDRPIVRHMDDSVVHIVCGEPQFLRRARGYAPLPVAVPDSDRVVLALGGHQKNTIALGIGDRVFVSQHIGDLESLETKQAFERVVFDFLRLYAVTPDIIAHDLHPDYASTQLAEQLTASGGRLAGIQRVAVQHHHAHLAACLGDANHSGPVLGVVWDGSGLGSDGTIWGGEFLLGDCTGFQRVAAIKPYPLLGGEAAAREPRRAALALLWSTFGSRAFDWDDLPPIASTPKAERALILKMLERNIGTPLTSSVGRLFDAVASLSGLVKRTTFEGRGGMLLEGLCDESVVNPYPLRVIDAEPGGETFPHNPRWWLDLAALIEAVVCDVRNGVPHEVVANRFHAALIAATVEVAVRIDAKVVVLTGGCFQNRRLTAGCVGALAKQQIRVFVHNQVPANDGGLSLGQALVARAGLRPDGAPAPNAAL
jgi:hydrogenase maturation protein HypF